MLDRNPFKGPTPDPDVPEQDTPGVEAEMKPRADHGERSYQGSGRLEGLSAIVTGGDSGIGRAVAIAFAREGADVAIGYLSEEEDADAQETRRWVEEAGRRCIVHRFDVRESAECTAFVEKVVEEFNIFGYMYMARAALPHLREGSVILNTGSVVALQGNPMLLDYAATKGAIHVFSMSLADALSDRGIRVNVVAPGPVWTPLIPSTMPPEHVRKFGEDTFWKRPAQPVELAGGYVYLASADARYVSGEVLAITGKTSSR